MTSKLFYVVAACLFAGCASTTFACNSLSSVPDTVAAARMVVFGELHGSNESPDFIARYLCTTARRDKPTVLALEVPVEEQKLIDAFLESGGGEEALRKLASGEFWTRAMHDGRSSTAMLRLIDAARKLSSDGFPTSVLAFASYDKRPGDTAMAENIKSALASDESLRAVVLTGNVHGSKEVGSRWDPNYQPLGSFLARDLGALSFRMRSTGGSFWACIGGRCDVQTRSAVGVAATDTPFGDITFEENIPGYDGAYFVGGMSASAPPNLDSPSIRQLSDG